jgi:hypothetical protein
MTAENRGGLLRLRSQRREGSGRLPTIRPIRTKLAGSGLKRPSRFRGNIVAVNGIGG